MFIRSRLTVVAVVITLLFSVLLWRVFYLQIVNGKEYQDHYTLKIVKERTLNSTRGNIYDRNGKLLAYNELAYTITIEDNGTYSSNQSKNDSLNAEIAQIITALEKNGDAIINDFKIDYSGSGYRYNVEKNAAAWKRFIADVYGETSYDNLKYNKKLGYNPAEATEQQVMDYLRSSSRFGISEEYEEKMAYQIAVVRFAMSQNAYQKYIVTNIAANVSEESVAYISEHASQLQGVEVASDTVRKYNDSEYFSSIIGYTGKISTEEYNKLSEEDDSYTLNDVVGKLGIEQYMDRELKGTKGYEKLYVDHLGKAVEIISHEDPVAGGNVYISINSDWQAAIYNLLEQEIAGIVYSNIENPSSDISIPMTDVYFALINNNVIDIEKFYKTDSSAAEKEVWQLFSSRQEDVVNQIRSELKEEGAAPFVSLSEEYQDYYTYIINLLKEEQILVTSRIDSSDTVYQKWKNGEISPQEYLKHTITQNWIDITSFSVEEKYSDSTEIYASLCDYIIEDISIHKTFSKIIYEYLIKAGVITGRQLCLILFDQNVLTFDDEEVAGLSNGTIAPNAFLKEKIKNLEITPAQLALDPYSGSCVVADTDTGEILALVSYPGYDANKLANKVDAEYFESLKENDSRPLLNYATQQGTAPGSTFKMVTATAGLAENCISSSEQILDTGEYENVSNKPKCWIYPSAHGLLNVSEALRDSCNYFFYEVGYRLSTGNYSANYSDEAAKHGISLIEKYASLYGLDETTGIEIEESSPQIADDFPVMAAIGQSNNSYTTVQLSRYVTAVANSGTVYEYTLLNRVEDNEGKVQKVYEPKVRNTIDVLSAEDWEAIHSGMRMMVENSAEFTDFALPAAGKTGTAQQSANRPNHALFVGYAPYDNPKLSIASRIAYGYTSHNAAELSRNVLSYCLGVEDKDTLLSGQAEEVNGTSNAFSD